MSNRTIDEIGALRLLDRSTILSSLRCIRKGRVLSLAQTYDNNMPTIWFHGPFFCTTFRTVANTLELFKEDYKNRLGSMVCRYELSDHTGTHVDSLNHATEGFELFGGVDARKIATDSGTTVLGIDTMPPVVTRGVLLDFPSYFGVDILDKEYEIKVSDVTSLISKNEIEIRSGDAVFFYSGYCKFWGIDNSRYLENGPGPGISVAKWLVRKKVAIMGADTACFEVDKKKTELLFPCHQILLKQNGIHLVENMKLDILAKEHIKEFLFVCTPLKLKGGAGSPVAPIAIF